ncbi:GNAT family N-acetyltransferase [Streptomyces rimosus]|uniref:GNAT family N-acetyltransferase n=1 Tax=Streptomyces rimosus TaxID=1927 RepID=UPI0004CBE7EB|nr:GNAT family N-acetyltransferase [Streptomyces rimosus]
MSSPTIIRPYRPADEPAITGLWPRATRQPDRTETWVAADERNGEVVGLLTLLGSEISGLYVAPEARGRGIGTQLVEHAASLRGALALEVPGFNTSAHAFFTHLGFTEHSRRTADSTGETLVALDRPAPLRSVGWLHVRDGRLLSVRTRGNDTFYLPGGKYEPGETAPEALSRELSEELGLTVPADELRQAFVIHATAHGVNAGRRLHMTCFTGGPQNIDPAPGREIAEYAWFDREESRERCAPAHMQVVNRLIAQGRMAA